MIAWQKARVLTRDIYEMTRTEHFARDYSFCSQIQRAAVSIMSNIAEGFERNNSGDFQRFLAIAKGSCGEVRSQLYIAFDIGYINQPQFDQLTRQSIEVSKVISGLHISVQANWRGQKKPSP